METSKSQIAYERIKDILSTLSTFEIIGVVGALNSSISKGHWIKVTLFDKKKLGSKILQNNELHDFILSMDLFQITQKDVRLACIKQFGVDKVPCRSSFSRAWKTLLLEKQSRGEHEEK